MTTITTTNVITLPPVRVAGIDLSVRRDFQEPGGGPPDGYPYKDGPLPDAYIREPLFSLMMATLHTRFDPRSDVALSGDVFIYYRDEADECRALAPDVVALFGPDFAQYRGRNGISLGEMGKPPDFVMEIASPSTYRADLGYKRDAYHWMGVGEYWLFDPDGGEHYGQPLAWEQLVDGQYQAMPVQRETDGIIWAYSPALGLDICADGGMLRFYDPINREYVRNQPEEKAAREAAEAARDQAEAAREQAEAARDRAKAAREQSEAALAAEQAARQQMQAELQQMQAEMERLRAGGSAGK